MRRNDIIRARLLEALGRRNMSQAELARRCGIPATTVGDWVRGRTGMMAYNLGRVCAALGVSADWMLGLREVDE